MDFISHNFNVLSIMTLYLIKMIYYISILWFHCPKYDFNLIILHVVFMSCFLIKRLIIRQLCISQIAFDCTRHVLWDHRLQTYWELQMWSIVVLLVELRQNDGSLFHILHLNSILKIRLNQQHPVWPVLFINRPF